MKIGLLGLAAVLAVGCGSSSASAPRAFAPGPEDAMIDAELSAAAPTSVPPLTEIRRADVDQVIQGGIGRFLQEVSLDAELEGGKFVGFRIRRFTNREKWLGVGIEVGDVITSVNDLPIERPEQAYEAFVALKDRKYLDVTYRRGDQVHRLSLPIVGERAGSLPEAPPASSTATPAKGSRAQGEAAPKGPKPAR